MRTRLTGFLVVMTLLGAGLVRTVVLRQRQRQATRALAHAVQTGNPEEALAALRDGADPNTTSTTFPLARTASRPVEISPLVCIAAHYHDEAILDALVHAGANVNAATTFGETALRTTSIYMLNDSGTYLFNDRSTPSALARDVRMVKLLLDHGANIDAQTGKVEKPGLTTLICAAAGNDTALPLLQLLLQRGAQIDARGYNGMTALMVAASSGRMQRNHSAAAVRFLVARGAHVNDRDDSGCSPLMYAARGGTDADVAALLAAGADANARDRKGRSALEYARNTRNTEVIAPLMAPRIVTAALTHP